ncbi:MAG: hypothetical protein C0402_05415 [Thermodesulfovibrio sp.]|nr:hypothetical protein [Thermodesulfovibrio sp.]
MSRGIILGYDIYFAAPLFSLAEQQFNQKLAEYLRRAGKYNVFLPQEKCKGVSDPQQIFDICMEGLNHSRIVVAVLDGPDADSGTCFEAGYAHGQNKPVLGVRTDFRMCELHNVNIMLYYSSDVLVQELTGDADKLFTSVLMGVKTLIDRSASPGHFGRTYSPDVLAAFEVLLNSADDTGCTDDLTVVSKEALESLEAKVIFPS